MDVEGGEDALLLPAWVLGLSDCLGRERELVGKQELQLGT